ncbi:Rud3p [Sugiyamaella lignohabitans]|uniref:Rud3p n=1 Tax=Sugiyamaella lignohabitans TaxID=796027 RepID=A0A170QZK2_9ASCO|nr:Rud3p [Sugiyamaella lignohabitans]ANB16015.1 Rud3p [Sugiyamaella lignohabitans]
MGKKSKKNSGGAGVAGKQNAVKEGAKAANSENSSEPTPTHSGKVGNVLTTSAESTHSNGKVNGSSEVLLENEKNAEESDLPPSNEFQLTKSQSQDTSTEASTTENHVAEKAILSNGINLSGSSAEIGNYDSLTEAQTRVDSSDKAGPDVTSLETKLLERNNEISSLQKTVNESNLELRKLKSLLQEKDAEILDLTSKVSSDESSQDFVKLKEELLEANAAKENAEEQYESLLEKISQIKSTLGARLKSDAEELSAYQAQVEELQREKRELSSSIQTLQQEAIAANKESDHLSHELSQLRNEFQSKMQEWSNERETLVKEKRLEHEKSEKFESMVRDLEVAIADDHSLRENANSRISGLEEQITTQTNYAERYRTERDELKAQLQSVQKQLESRALEYSEKLAVLESQNQHTQAKFDSATLELTSAKTHISNLEASNKRLSVLESEVKEKGLLIGKLRHEAVILNEHLTKALRMIKKDSEGETVDKLLVSNLLLSFLSFQRGDAKKFEVLQLIANFLGWDEDQKAQAGLTRLQGSVNNTASPRRSQSSNSLPPLAEDGSSAGRFMGLFAEFLERESTKRSSTDQQNQS